jgi:hypothetical protein
MKGSAAGTGDWQLFNLRKDPAGLHNQSAKHPEKRDELIRLWEKYAKSNGVLVGGAGPFAEAKWHPLQRLWITHDGERGPALRSSGVQITCL